MKPFIIAIFFICCGYVAKAQEKQANYYFQADLSINKTLHYQAPIHMVVCREGCTPIEQVADWSGAYSFSIYRAFANNNAIKIGLGNTVYRFFESGLASPGDNTQLPYQVDRKYNFITLSTGYRHFLSNGSIVSPFVEATAMYERLLEADALIRGGFAAQTEIGTVVHVQKNCNLIASGFFRSAIRDYKSKSPFFEEERYIPFAYGVKLGITISL